MATQYPLTSDQLNEMVQDLANMHLRAEEMFHLMAAGCGPSDQRTIRAEELAAAIQRLEWAIKRTHADNTIAAAG
jgi:hypothetical protein